MKTHFHMKIHFRLKIHFCMKIYFHVSNLMLTSTKEQFQKESCNPKQLFPRVKYLSLCERKYLSFDVFFASPPPPLLSFSLCHYFYLLSLASYYTIWKRLLETLRDTDKNQIDQSKCYLRDSRKNEGESSTEAVTKSRASQRGWKSSKVETQRPTQ